MPILTVEYAIFKIIQKTIITVNSGSPRDSKKFQVTPVCGKSFGKFFEGLRRFPKKVILFWSTKFYNFEPCTNIQSLGRFDIIFTFSI